MRTFTADDIQAIRETCNFSPYPANLITMKIHDISNAQLWSINHLPLSDAEIAAKFHLLPKGKVTLREVCDIYGVDYADTL